MPLRYVAGWLPCVYFPFTVDSRFPTHLPGVGYCWLVDSVVLGWLPARAVGLPVNLCASTRVDFPVAARG